MNKDLLIVVDQSHVARLGEVVERLRAAGVDVHDANDLVGTVTGSIDDQVVELSTLETVDGVDIVEEQDVYELPPPDSPIQ